MKRRDQKIWDFFLDGASDSATLTAVSGGKKSYGGSSNIPLEAGIVGRPHGGGVFPLDLAIGVYSAHRVDRPLWPLGAMESVGSGVVADFVGSVSSGHGMGRDPRRGAIPCRVPQEERGRKEVLR